MKKSWNKPTIYTLESNELKKEIFLYAASGNACANAVSLDINIKF